MLAILGCIAGLGLIELAEIICEHDMKNDRNNVWHHEGWGADFE